jgi:arylsulfatase A-like enzyme
MKNAFILFKPCFLALTTVLLATGLRAPVHGADISPAPVSNHEPKLNVVFFLVDDLGWRDLGCDGSTAYHTPNIDAFAKQGVRFSQAYAACPVCSPSRASILTGQYPARLHLTDWLPGRGNHPFQKLQNSKTVQHLPYNQKTLPQVLKDNGYRTAIFGKWHLGEDPESTKKQGFDLHVPEWNKGWPNKTYFSPYGLKGLEGGPKGEYLTDRLTDEALKWVSENKDHPFFLYLAHFAVHDPIQGRPDLVAKYEQEMSRATFRGAPYVLEGNPDDSAPFSAEALNGLLQDKRYRGFSLLPHRTVKIRQHQDNPEFAGMVQSMDESLGRVLARLKQLKLEDRTIVIFFSDNGGMSAANFGNPNRRIPKANLNKNYSTSNLPLRGGKGWLYEGGIRVPLIVFNPKQPPVPQGGSVCDVPVISTDFYATILDMLGLKSAQTQPNGIDGMSFLPLLNGGKDAKIEKRALYWHWPHYSNHGAQSPGGAIRRGDFKLIEYYENNTAQLFNLRTDLQEAHDLSASQPEKTEELRTVLHAWRKSVNAEMPQPNPKYDPSQKWPDGAIDEP